MIKQVKAQKAAARAAKERRPVSAVLALALLLAAGSAYVTQADCAEVLARKRELPVYSVERDDRKIAISFDAAWGGDKTEGILDILDEYGVKTTFFLVDTWTQKYPGLVKEIHTRGHEIGNHSTTHPQMSRISTEQMRKELSVMAQNVEKLTGERPTLFRPPYGDYSNQVILTAREEGYTPVQWSVDSLDWKNRGAEDMIRRATGKINSGDIVLFHNDAKYILDALPAILKSYREQGFTVVPVGELLLEGETTIDAQGKQRPAAAKIPEVQ